MSDPDDIELATITIRKVFDLESPGGFRVEHDTSDRLTITDALGMLTVTEHQMFFDLTHDEGDA